MTHNFFEVLIDNQTLKHFKTAQKLFFKQYCYFNLISDFNFYIKYCSEKANVKTDTFIKMSDCVRDQTGMATNIAIMAKMATNLDCSLVRVRSIYKTKDKEVRFKRQQQKLCKWEIKCASVQVLQFF